LFESILDELIVTLEKLNEHRRIFSFEEFYDYITSSIFGSRFNIKERWGYGVLVTSPDEIRGLSYSILFLPGLENGIFPSPYKPLLFLEDKFIRNEKQKLLEERYLFYQCLNAFEDELYLSYPKQDDKKEKIISDFLLQLQKICDIQEFDKSELAQFVFSESEMFEKFSVDDLLNLNSNNRELIAKISKVNEVLSRIKLRMENSYQNEELAKEFCGIITDKELINKLYNKDHYFSITEIETFALCPFKYFINYIIEPEFEQEIEEDIQRNEFGIIVHQILYKFFKKLKSENRNFYEELKNNKGTLLNELKDIALEIIKIYERLNPFFFLTEELILGSDRRKSILEHFLELEEELIESDVLFIPTEFEKEIKESFLSDDEEIKLRGKIDRIDISEESKLFKVIDYKTGKTPERKDYLDNLSFQLPLYLLLVQKYFQSLNLNYKIYDAEFIKLAPTKKDGIKRSSFIKDYLKGSDIDESLKNVLRIVAELISKIREGQFNLTTIENFEKRVCGTCNYSSICRIDMIKKKQKN
jgi:ATP-dependent helicase/nuclease subunit B